MEMYSIFTISPEEDDNEDTNVAILSPQQISINMRYQQEQLKLNPQQEHQQLAI